LQDSREQLHGGETWVAQQRVRLPSVRVAVIRAERTLQ